MFGLLSDGVVCNRLPPLRSEYVSIHSGPIYNWLNPRLQSHRAGDAYPPVPSYGLFVKTVHRFYSAGA